MIKAGNSLQQAHRIGDAEHLRIDPMTVECLVDLLSQAKRRDSEDQGEWRNLLQRYVLPACQRMFWGHGRNNRVSKDFRAEDRVANRRIEDETDLGDSVGQRLDGLVSAACDDIEQNVRYRL